MMWCSESRLLDHSGPYPSLPPPSSLLLGHRVSNEHFREVGQREAANTTGDDDLDDLLNIDDGDIDRWHFLSGWS